MIDKFFLIFSFFYICLGFYFLTIKQIYRVNFFYNILCISLILCSINYVYLGYLIFSGEIIVPLVKRHLFYILTSFPDILSFIFGFMMSLLYIRFLFDKKYMIKNVSKDLYIWKLKKDYRYKNKKERNHKKVSHY